MPSLLCLRIKHGPWPVCFAVILQLKSVPADQNGRRADKPEFVGDKFRGEIAFGGEIPTPSGCKKPLLQAVFLWRWRESNPRPKDSTLGYTTSVVYLLI